MAEIKITATPHDGAAIPRRHGAVLRKVPWGTGTTHELVLYIGSETIRIWPADRDRIKQLGERLIELSESL